MAIGYAMTKDRNGEAAAAAQPIRRAVALNIAAVVAGVAILTLIATAGSPALPSIMAGNSYTPVMIVVVSAVWVLSLAALGLLWVRRPHSVLDVWLMVVMVAWLFDIALAAVLNAGRFDVGFYAGRIYGLLAASFVLIVLLLETAALYAHLARSFKEQQQRDAAEISRINARLSTVLDSSPLPVFSLDPQGLVASWNGAAERVFGHPAADAIGRPFSSLQQAGNGELEAARIRAMNGETLRNLQMQWAAPGGQPRDIMYAMAPIAEADGRIGGAVCVAEDVTDKIRLERQLMQAQKMEAIGQLTGGVAHDFNNLLTVITGVIDTLRDGVADRPDLAALATMIDQAATRGADLTRHMLAFARKQPLQPRDTDLNALAEDSIGLLRPALGAEIEIETVLAPDAWHCLIDPSQLTSALLNLSINARDAMPRGGKITLETANAMLDEAYAKENSDVTPGRYVMIAVSDTGTGIPAEIRDRVFDPFFTTKEVGQGTGLGLSMVFGFIKQSGGHIKIYSEVGHGTTIKMYLPRAQQAEDAAQESAPSRPRGGSETILVVEDDALVRRNVVAQLTGLGYTTIEAADGVEALRVVETNGAIDLLFTDVVMPGGINGRMLADEVTRKRPAIRVLFTSGYAQNAIVHHGRLEAGVHLLGKPYRTADLARMVRVALE
jgi:PAS domain S-box-containing protein